MQIYEMINDFLIEDAAKLLSNKVLKFHVNTFLTLEL